MAWLYLFTAGIFEIIFALGLKHCNSFKPSLPLFTVATSMTISLICLNIALREIPISISYTVWTGMGIVGVTLYDFFIVGNSLSYLQLICLSFIVLGILGLKLSA